ncbi:dihydrofolate reductase [Roseivirga sp. BDSF3-8]|uniref:dihydrofolate reductase n=1 Tax=Roseivirga sp. BDSF3-8 TaxID=3241598 RepID=UPI003531FA3C
MIRSIIVAKSENNVIGKDNDLVWKMPADLKHFRTTTTGHFIVMGRKTLEATQKPLPGRTSIVITRQQDFRAEGCLVVNSLEEAYALGEKYRQEELFILGGGEIYKQAMTSADKIYLTEIKETFKGDTYFPEIDYTIWKEVKREEHKADEKNPHDYAFIELVRK